MNNCLKRTLYGKPGENRNGYGPAGGVMRFALLILGVIASIAVTGCAHFGRTVEPPTVRLVDMAPASSTLFEQRVLLTFRIVNPNPFALSWTGVKVNTRVNDMDLLPGVSSENGRVEALGESVFKVEASASTFNLLRQILNFQGGQNTLTYALEGILYQGGFGTGGIEFSTDGALWDSSPEL